MIKLDSVNELNILDLGLGMAAALISKFMVEAGARVYRIEPQEGDPFYELYPAYRMWRAGCRFVAAEQQQELLRQADVCVIGGEDFPGLSWTHDAKEIAARNPRLIVLELSGYMDSANATRGPAVDLLVQASSGIVFQQYGKRPLHMAFPAPTYGAVLHGLLGLWGALIYRARGGPGQVVSTSLQQGASMWFAPSWLTVERPDAAIDSMVMPKGVRPLIFRCADGKFVHLVTGTPGSLAKLYRVLGIDQSVDPTDRGAPSSARKTCSTRIPIASNDR
jgi:crotonobetainyl-CoA:carnitine CoA-transferase CaiB-like acyl-CoA transferase